jgi:Ala-tRNA(Pro) deacylase
MILTNKPYLKYASLVYGVSLIFLSGASFAADLTAKDTDLGKQTVVANGLVKTSPLVGEADPEKKGIASIATSKDQKLGSAEDEKSAFGQLVSLLTREKADFRVVEHAAEGQCDKVAALRGSTLAQSAKAILVKAEITKKARDYYLLVLSASQQVDFGKVKELASGAKSVGMADPKKAQELTNCVMGSIPPFSFNSQLKMIVDPVVLADDNMELAFNAGRLDRSIFLRIKDYKRLINAKVKSISKQQ